MQRRNEAEEKLRSAEKWKIAAVQWQKEAEDWQCKPRRRRNFNAKITSKFKGGSSRRLRGRRRRKILPSSTPATCRTSAGLSATCPTTSYPRRSSGGEGHRQGQVRYSRLRPIY